MFSEIMSGVKQIVGYVGNIFWNNHTYKKNKKKNKNINLSDLMVLMPKIPNNCLNIINDYTSERNISLDLIQRIIPNMPNVCLNIILEYSHIFDGKEILKFNLYFPCINILQLPNGNLIAFHCNPSFDINFIQSFKIINSKTGSHLKTINIQKKVYSHLILQNSNIAIVSDTTIEIYDTTSGDIISSLNISPNLKIELKIESNHPIFSEISNDIHDTTSGDIISSLNFSPNLKIESNHLIFSEISNDTMEIKYKLWNPNLNTILEFYSNNVISQFIVLTKNKIVMFNEFCIILFDTFKSIKIILESEKINYQTKYCIISEDAICFYNEQLIIVNFQNKSLRSFNIESVILSAAMISSNKLQCLICNRNYFNDILMVKTFDIENYKFDPKIYHISDELFNKTSRTQYSNDPILRFIQMNHSYTIISQLKHTIILHRDAHIRIPKRILYIVTLNSKTGIINLNFRKRIDKSFPVLQLQNGNILIKTHDTHEYIIYN